MAHRIDTVDARSKLKARPVPYWAKLSTGAALGFRKMTPTSEGTWLAQSYDPETRKQTRRSLGSFEALPAIMRWPPKSRCAWSRPASAWSANWAFPA